MNYYERNVNSFLSGVSSNMSAVYLPALFVSLIELLEDYYKFDAVPEEGGISVNRTTVKISYELVSAYFLAHLLKIRKEIPAIKMAPTKGKTHDERFILEIKEIDKLDKPGEVIKSELFAVRGPSIIRKMKDGQNVFPVFEKRCQIMQCHRDYIAMDIAAVDTLLSNSIMYKKMSDLICFQYLSRIKANRELRAQLEDYFIRNKSRLEFSQEAKEFVIEYQENRCYYCGRKMASSNFHLKPKADHFVPWVFIRTSQVENLVYACHDCNSSKSDRLPSVNYFNKMVQRNALNSDFWRSYPGRINNLEERIKLWVRSYYQASEQLSTGWKPEG